MTSLGRAKLMGIPSPHPAIPDRNLSGEFFSEPGGLVFRPDNTNYPSLVIAWDHLRQWQIVQGLDGGLDRLTWLLWGLPIVLLTLGLVYPQKTYIALDWYDDTTESDLRAAWQVGDLFDLSTARHLVANIWKQKGY